MNLRTVAATLLGLVCAAILIALLLRSTNLDQLSAMLAHMRPVWLVALFAATALHIFFAAEKWRLVESAICGTPPARSRAFAYSAVGTAVGQLLPSQVANAAARGLGNRWHVGAGARRGVMGSLWEQGFDLLVMALLAAPAAAALAWSNSALFLVLAPVTLLGGAFILKRCLRLAPRLKESASPRLRRFAAVAIETGLLSDHLTCRLYGLSVARVLVLWLMAVAVTYATESSVPITALAVCLPLAVLASVLSMLPAGIGANEWSFTAGLTLLGVALPIAAAWALVNRLLVAQAALLLGVAGLAMMGRRSRLPKLA